MRRASIIGCVVGLVLALLSLIGPIREMGMTFLPLAYLDVIGLIVLGMGFLFLFASLFYKGDQKYLTHGVPMPAQVLSVVRVPVSMHNGTVARRAFEVLLSIYKYEGLAPIARNVRVHEMSDEASKKYELDFDPGDWVTGIYLQNDFDNSLTIYECLDFHPDQGLRRPDGYQPDGIVKTTAAILAIVGFIFSMFWMIWATDRYEMIDGMSASGHYAVAGATAVLGTIMCVLIHIFTKPKPEVHGKSISRNGEIVDVEYADVPFKGRFRVLAFLGCFLMPAALLGSVAKSMNANLDDSRGKFVDATVIDLECTTMKMIYRSYKLRLNLEDEDNRFGRSVGTDPETYADFAVASLTNPDPEGELPCKVEIGEGAFGWPWIRAVHINPIPEPEIEHALAN